VLSVPPAFDCTLLSEPLRPLFTQPLEVAHLGLRAFARKAGNEALADGVTIQYASDESFDACAFEAGNREYVVVSTAAPALLQGIFFDVVRDTNPFSLQDDERSVDEAQPGDFRVPLELPVAGFGDAHMVAAIESLLRGGVPDEKWQRILSVALGELATVFLFTHELGHVVRGHARLLSRFRAVRLAEIGFGEKGAPGRVSRAWELQADQTAFAFLWSYAINTQRQRERFIRQLKCTGPEPVLDLLGRICYAISFVFFLIAQGHNRVQATGSHPSPLVRITFLLAMAETAMEAQYPHLADRVHESVTRAHDFAEAAWNRLGLEFGVRGYSEHIEDLPHTVATSQRHMHHVARALSHHAWAFPKPAGSRTA